MRNFLDECAAEVANGAIILGITLAAVAMVVLGAFLVLQIHTAVVGG